MSYNCTNSMDELISGIGVADPVACYEFARRQHKMGHIGDLIAGAALLHDIVFDIRLERPEELMRWKTPEHISPITSETLKAILSAASDNRRDEARQLVADQSFADVATLASIACHISTASKRIQRYADTGTTE